GETASLHVTGAHGGCRQTGVEHLAALRGRGITPKNRVQERGRAVAEVHRAARCGRVAIESRASNREGSRCTLAVDGAAIDLGLIAHEQAVIKRDGSSPEVQ